MSEMTFVGKGNPEPCWAHNSVSLKKVFFYIVTRADLIAGTRQNATQIRSPTTVKQTLASQPKLTIHLWSDSRTCSHTCTCSQVIPSLPKPCFAQADNLHYITRCQERPVSLSADTTQCWEHTAQPNSLLYKASPTPGRPRGERCWYQMSLQSKGRVYVASSHHRVIEQGLGSLGAKIHNDDFH